MAKEGHWIGPWRCRQVGDEWRVLVGDVEGFVVATCGEQACHDGVIAANARLIAAAPELLSALIRLREWVRSPGEDDSPENESVIDQAEAAIAKATT